MSESDTLTSRQGGNQSNQIQQAPNQNSNGFQQAPFDHSHATHSSCCLRCNARASALKPLWIVLLLTLSVLSVIDGHWQGILFATLGAPLLLINSKLLGCRGRSEFTPLQPNNTEYGTETTQALIVTAKPGICMRLLWGTLIVLKWSYAVFLFILVGVRVAGSVTARDWSTFPTSCIDTFPNCCRVVVSSNCTSSFVDSASPALELQAYTDTKINASQVLSQVKGFFGLASDEIGWFSDAKVKADTSTADGFTLHIVALTPLLGFPDDVAVRVKRMNCSEVTVSDESVTALVIEMQSKSRLGYGDAGVNYLRIQRLQHQIEAYAFSVSGDAAPGSCQIDQIE